MISVTRETSRIQSLVKSALDKLTPRLEALPVPAEEPPPDATTGELLVSLKLNQYINPGKQIGAIQDQIDTIHKAADDELDDLEEYGDSLYQVIDFIRNGGELPENIDQQLLVSARILRSAKQSGQNITTTL